VVFFGARWLHDNDEDPVVLYQEIGPDRFEVRKVHEFRDGTRERTDQIEPEKRTSLSWMEIPPLEQIHVESEFEVFTITAEEFEEVWTSASDA